MTESASPGWRRELADRIGALVRRNPRRPLVVGLAGPQGSGKTTAAVALQEFLQEEHALRAAILSLDDLYLTRAERQRLAEDVHPLLATRGPPGTHDVTLGLQVLADLGSRKPTRLPRFDKATDDRMRLDDWPLFIANCDCILFEGWCVGAHAQWGPALIRPINALEAEEDANHVWRRYVNAALARPYRRLFGKLDYLAMIRPPSFEQVLDWRMEQEHDLQRTRTGVGVMSDEDLARFVQHYERVTRWMDVEMPARADAVITLEADRSLRNLVFKAPIPAPPPAL